MWSEFFEKADAPNLFKIMQYVLAIFVSNAHVERGFSVMNALWSDARNRMSTELVKAEICVQINNVQRFLQRVYKKQDTSECCDILKKY
ncbi:hypothetical protein C0J52_21480 [Blattella germanica]|nr:hypothetical protein C0J52_21480 [Blattella germanica]